MNRIAPAVVLFMVCCWGGFARAEGSGPELAAKPVVEIRLKGDQEKKLGYSAEQKAALNKLDAEFKGRQKPLQTDLRAKREELVRELDADKLDRKKVDKLIKDINSLQRQILANNAELVFRKREIMTPEQFQMLKTWRQERDSKKAAKGTGKQTKKSGVKGK